MDVAFPIVLTVIYILLGVVLMLKMDSSQRWYALMDRMTPLQQLVCVLAWPLALPWWIWRLRRG
jgi:hypothetical protein